MSQQEALADNVTASLVRAFGDKISKYLFQPREADLVELLRQRKGHDITAMFRVDFLATRCNYYILPTVDHVGLSLIHI